MPRVTAGRPHPLGATLEGDGVHFAVASEVATRVDLCLFHGDEGDDGDATEVIALPPVGAHVFAAHVAGVGPGQRYGYRVDGPFDPAAGHRCNYAKLLVDPYARAIAGSIDPRAPLRGSIVGADGIERVDGRDDAHGVPRSVVVDPHFAWGDDRAPAIPWSELVIYELHVKGFTRQHPGVPEALRGTYAGLACPAVIDHLLDLGVNAVELLPVFEIADELPLLARGAVNYWGYSTLGYFAPAARYAAHGDRGEQVAEFKAMVAALHRAGIEVILDVVYNHSGEGGIDGPTLSLRGLDNHSYYRLRAGDRRHYVDTSACGNSLDLADPQGLRLVMDSLRAWAIDMRVDGFRFDLAPTLARDHGDFDPRSRFLVAVHQDPVLSRRKLIAEPWDVGPGGYRVGGFPPGWAEWNDKFRECARRFWRGDPGHLGELATRLAGSADLFGARGRSPQASVNYITAHDGFTLRDLVSYSRKHNLANGEGNRDGNNHESSDNHGVEGPSDDPTIEAARAQHQRTLLATLIFAQGVPMLLAGDELGRTQGGNNNAYCQDNEVSWISWAPTPSGEALRAWVRRLLAIRRAHPQLRRVTFLRGAPAAEGALEDVRWLRPDGSTMDARGWATASERSLGMLLGAAPADGERGPAALLLAIHGGPAPLEWSLPSLPFAVQAAILVDSARPDVGDAALVDRRFSLAPRSLALLRLDRTDEAPRHEAPR